MALDISPEVRPAAPLALATPPSAEAIYRDRCDRFGAARDFYTARWNRVANARLAVFVLAAGCLGWGVWQDFAAAYVVAGLLFLVFLGFVRLQARLGRERQRYTILWEINDEAGKRVRRDWNALPLRHTFRADPTHPYAVDLDLFGRASLFQWLETVTTSMGETTLREWLLAPAPPVVARARQAAVAELAPLIDLRDELALRGRRMGETRPDPAPFLAWAEGEPWLLKRPAQIALARFLGIATPAALLLWAASVLPIGVFIFLASLNLGTGYRLRKQTLEVFDQVQAREDDFQRYADAMERIDSRSWVADELRRIAGGMTLKDQPAHRWMSLLHSRVELSNVRHSSYLQLLLQGLFCWNLHVLALLERWQQEAGPHVRSWLAALGRFEALSALANLRFENPGWAFPTVADGEPSYEARQLGHPLIREDKRVSNDVTLGPPGTFLLVTGSNMSGKSTLLRSIGINAVLAQAGGPVCAESLRMPPVTLGTSVLVEDSLAEGVSFFMAELQRIRWIVKEADRAHAEGRILLYLLDEVLRGTNSYERQVAVRRVVLHLLKQGALGAVSTHDLQLAEVPEIASVCVPVHFRETLHPGEDPPMTFDYKMHPGVATTVNALKLMELVGLGAEEI